MADALLALPSSPHYFVLPSPTMSELGCLTEVRMHPHILFFTCSSRNYRKILPYTGSSHHILHTFTPYSPLLPSHPSYSLYFKLILKGFWRSIFCEKQLLRQQVKMITIQCSTMQSSILLYIPSFLFYSLGNQLSKCLPFYRSYAFLSHPSPNVIPSHPTLPYPTLPNYPLHLSAFLSHPTSLLLFFSVGY